MDSKQVVPDEPNASIDYEVARFKMAYAEAERTHGVVEVPYPGVIYIRHRRIDDPPRSPEPQPS